MNSVEDAIYIEIHVNSKFDNLWSFDETFTKLTGSLLHINCSNLSKFQVI